MGGHAGRQAAVVLHGGRRLTRAHDGGAVGPLDQRGDKGGAAVLHDTHYGAQPYVAEVHDRMPVILRFEQFEGWLDGSSGADDIRAPIAEDHLTRCRVSRHVNSSPAPNDDATLIDEAT